MEYHYVMTVQTRDGTQATLQDVVTVTPGRTTRSVAYREIRAMVARELGLSRFIVLFFAMEPNQL